VEFFFYFSALNLSSMRWKYLLLYKCLNQFLPNFYPFRKYLLKKAGFFKVIKLYRNI
jgi:hypothetical protein